MKRVAPAPAVPSMSSVPASPAAADRSTDASDPNASSRPTNRALASLTGMAAILGRCRRPRVRRVARTVPPAGAVGSGWWCARATPGAATLQHVTDGPRPPHPANDLNDLSGEQWLYFTKSMLTTAYPSELGHAARKAHGANKPPRLMARLIEFFSKTGELVLDPFAGVGGTLLGAAIARGPRRAIGIELDERWVAVYHDVVAALSAERDGLGPTIADLGTADPGPPRTFDPSGLEMRHGDALAVLASLADGSVDCIATDPPYNIQLPLTMAGGRAGRGPRQSPHGLRDDQPAPGRPGQRRRITRPSWIAWRTSFGELRRVLREGRYAVVIVRDAYQDGRYQFVGSDLAARADAAGLVPKGDIIWHQAGTRLRPYGYPRVFVPNITHQHVLVFRREAERSGRKRRPPVARLRLSSGGGSRDRPRARRCRRRRPSSRSRHRWASSPSARSPSRARR